MNRTEKKIPELRFPEFEGEWVEKRLGEVVSFLDGFRKPIKEADRYKIQGIYPYYGASGIIDYVNDYIFDDHLILLGEDGENILSRNLPLAFTVQGKIWVNNHAHVLKANRDYYTSFIALVLENVSYVKYNTGTAQPKLNQEVCKRIPLLFPLFSEQQKIADFLSAVDKRLQLLKDKKIKFEEYKRGVMQRIFSQELRFTRPDGSAYPDWEEKRLENLVSITTGKLDANAMILNGKYRFYTCAKEYYQIDKYAFDLEALLISGNGANVGYIHYYKGKFNAYQRTYVLSNFIREISVLYLKCFLDKNLSIRIAQEKREGNTPYITMSTLTDMNIELPCLDEQHRIADFLSSIDDKIVLLTKQIESTEQYKKGLLQQLFV